ncbi:MAG: glycosyltransferase family 39 protein [Candidatus Bathyarchaeota archaeon]|nr:glycosyltransferase family 39 protein [Candidatus Bathyarchaeota archaeon]
MFTNGSEQMGAENGEEIEMESNAMAEADEKQAKANLAVPLAVLTLLAFAWVVYVYANQTWLETLEQVADWIAKPVINFGPLQVGGIPHAALGTVEILVLGVISVHVLLPKEKDTLVKLLSALGLGVGLTGLITIILGIFGALFQLHLNAAILLLCIGFLLAVFRRHKGQIESSVCVFLKARLAIIKLRPGNLRFWLLPCIAIGVMFALCFYHALFTVVMHWDATVYHAVMAVIMYNNHGIPVIAGPSIGIQMSANFPPLFSALGAFYYIQMGLIEDFYLRAIPPVMGVLTALATYKIGETLAGKRYGLIAALLLAMTPLFFRYSIYATSYSTLTFFGTAAVMFMFLAMKKGENRYWAMCGVFYGFALLTSYIAMYLAPFFLITLTAVFIKNKQRIKLSAKIFVLLFLPALLVGGAWYIRNFVLLGNPVYPNAYTVLGGINIDPLIMETTVNGIKWSATRSLFGGDVALLDKIDILLTFRIHFPAISLLTILGVALVPTQNRKFWLLLAWPLILVAFILSGLTWGFPRHIVFATPGFALLSALPLAKALEHCEKYDKNVMMQAKDALGKMRKRLKLPRKSDLLRISIVIILIVAFIFPSLTFCMGGKIFMENLNDKPPYNFLWFLENPNAEKWTALSLSYPEAAAWKWLNEHLNEGEKVGTIENRVYYVKNCSNDYFFYLDGWEARYLYNMTEMTAILRYLQSENVRYILDVDWAREHGHFDVLPLARFLGTPFFPRIPYGGSQKLYKVGPLVNSPITENSALPTAINEKGWTEPQLVNGVLAQSVIAGSNAPRFFVATPNLTCVEITYLDAGVDKLSIYLYNPYSEAWFEYSFIEKTDTKEWKTHKFLVPINKEGYAEFGLHSYTGNFTISRIEAKPVEAEGKASLYSLEGKITSNTWPQTLMVYLPILGENQTVTVQTETFGNKVCIEIFEGVIQPWETTEWWMHRELATRTPDSITQGEVNPSLVWKVEKSGLYTLVVVLREENVEDASVNLQINIGGARQSEPVEKIREGGAGIRVIVMR